MASRHDTPSTHTPKKPRASGDFTENHAATFPFFVRSFFFKLSMCTVRMFCMLECNRTKSFGLACARGRRAHTGCESVSYTHLTLPTIPLV